MKESVGVRERERGRCWRNTGVGAARDLLPRRLPRRKDSIAGERVKREREREARVKRLSREEEKGMKGFKEKKPACLPRRA